MGGCAWSKLNDMPSVVLCHDRCRFLNAAISNRDSLSLSLSHFSTSLRSLSLSLSRSLYLSFFTTTHSQSHSQSDRCPPSPDFQSDRLFADEEPHHHPPPPPPPPPVFTPSSGWDFLSFFDSYERVDVNRSLKLVNEGGDFGFKEERDTTRGLSFKRDGSDGGEGGDGRLLCVVADFQSSMEKAAASCGGVSNMLVSMPSSNCEGSETTSPVNISSVMENLWIWEKKLYDEVKEEEKFKLIREKKYKQLKGMIEKGAEAHVLTESKSVISALSINIKIAVDIVDNISLTIKKLQNEELLPHLVSLFNGLKEMWRRMAQCQKKVCIALSQAKVLVKAMTKTEPTRRESHREAMTQLKLDLHFCERSFSGWMDAQRDYITVITQWLTAPLPFHEPKPVASPPVSPTKPDPLPFAFCHAWSRAVDPESLPLDNALLAMHDSLSLLDPLCVGPAGDELNQRGRSKRKVKGTPKVPKSEEDLDACLVRMFEEMKAVAETSLHFYEEVKFT